MPPPLIALPSGTAQVGHRSRLAVFRATSKFLFTAGPLANSVGSTLMADPVRGLGNAITTTGDNWFQPFTNLASAIYTKTRDTVLAYSWIDMSATNGYGVDPSHSLDPSQWNPYAAEAQEEYGERRTTFSH